MSVNGGGAVERERESGRVASGWEGGKRKGNTEREKGEG